MHNIYLYGLIIFLSFLLGQIVSHLNKKLPPVGLEEINYREFFKGLFKGFKLDIFCSIILVLTNISILITLGTSLTSYIYMFLTAILLNIFIIDLKHQIIPDELVILTFVLGIINILLNLVLWKTYLLGSVIGFTSFYALGVIGSIIFKKDGMGFGDVKLMAALGLLFGIKGILAITLLSFFIGAIVGILLLVIKSKKGNEYIPFGPFICIATFILLLFSEDKILNIYISMISFFSEKLIDLSYYIYLLFI